MMCLQPAMPTTDPERTAEAIQCALPELIKLERYERRAAARRARALRSFLEYKKYRTTCDRTGDSKVQNEPNFMQLGARSTRTAASAAAKAAT